MVAGLNSALDLKPLPGAILVLTDGYTPYPDTRPREPVVVWGILRSGEEKPPLPPCPPWDMRDIVEIPVGENHVGMETDDDDDIVDELSTKDVNPDAELEDIDLLREILEEKGPRIKKIDKASF